jgi:hypothetical protein
MRTMIFAILFLVFSNQAIADDSSLLKGQYIVDVGELDHLTCPVIGKYDCLTWPLNLYQIDNGQCMVVHGLGLSSSSDIALLAVGENKQVSLFTISSVRAGIQIDQHNI